MTSLPVSIQEDKLTFYSVMWQRRLNTECHISHPVNRIRSSRIQILSLNPFFNLSFRFLKNLSNILLSQSNYVHLILL